MADTTLLSWINAEVERALGQVQESIARFTAEPENQAVLRPCPEHLHQVSGALRMVGLNGATLVCEALESSFAGTPPTPDSMAVIDRAVVALKNFVGDLARGQADVPLRLFPVYRDLSRILGRPGASEKDLFFPDLTLPAPLHASPTAVPDEELPAFLQAQRGRFQRGLLAWLRGSPAGLDEMRQTADALHQVATQLPGPRALWWAAGALVDSLAAEADKDPEWLTAAKIVCNRLDFQIRDLAAGAARNGDTLLREVLYAVARREPATPRIREVQQLYQLQSLFPPPESEAPGEVLVLDAERLEASLFDMHSRLEALKRAWENYVGGDRDKLRPFRDQVASFRAKTQDLGNQHLIKLLDAIALVAGKLPDPYPRQQQMLVIEMASAFLLVEHIIDRFTQPADDLDAQIVIMGGWLLDAAAGKSTGEPPSGLRPDLTERIGALQLRAQVTREVLANLQHVEQVIDAFARDPGRRSTLAELHAYLRQVHGALQVLGFPGAAQAVSVCEGLILAQAGGQPTGPDDMDWIAEGLSCVAMFLEPCRHGREPAEEPVALFFRRYEGRHTPLQPSAPAPATAEAPSVDDELLSVFLDEAGEVLQTIEGALPRCREQPDDRDALTAIRRAFHTLKGSGRMVGLADLGEAAWEVEQAMNLWLDQKRPATPELLELVTTASASFAEWVGELKAGKAPKADVARIAELAARVRAGEPEAITVGTVTVSRGLYDIYTKEAAEHIAVLAAECGKWRSALPGPVSADFMRAAHTLASTSRTAGFASIAGLAGTLEQWTGFAGETAVDDAQVVEDAIARLRAMVDAVSRGEAPDAEPADGSLGALIARLEAARRTAHRPPAAPPPDGREKRVMRDDIDEQLLPVFIEEAQQLLPQVGADLRDWKANPGDHRISQSLRRSLHTLKGSARMAGAIRLGELCHLMESRIEAALEAGGPPSGLFEELEEKLDRVSADVERMSPSPVVQAAEAPPLPSPAALLRVDADRLDHLINEAGEMAIARSRAEAELRAAKHSLSDLGESVARLRAQLREVEVQADSQMQSRLSVMDQTRSEFDPLEFDRYTRLQELTRLMAESLNDVASIQHGLHKSIGDTDGALQQQARIGRELQQELMRVRAVPFSNLNERLYRIVRQVSRELSRKAELEITGAEVELDRGVLDRIAAPVEHMLRNSLVHGIEAPEVRAAAGKPEEGRIAIALRQESNEVVLTVSDDGRGLDRDALRSRGTELGLLSTDREPTDAEITQLVFATGLSTAERLTELAGRGVGMDVVRNEIASIGGRVDVASTPGRGTTFTLYLPLTLAVTQAVLVRSGETILALASGMVEQVLRLKGDALAQHYQAGELEFQEHRYPLHAMQALLGATAPVQLQPYNSVVLLRSGLQRIAAHVDELIGNQEIVVKAIGPQLSRAPGLTGATTLPDGRIALIMNPVQLAARAAQAPVARPPSETTSTRAAAAPVVMVVDDSLTVRKITGRLLEREGYSVVTAKDGVDALEQIARHLPKVMLVDIEMPRMDGFDLARNVRSDERTRAIPIIFISSRTAEKHREHAARLGVNAFLGKPYAEAELLDLVARLAA